MFGKKKKPESNKPLIELLQKKNSIANVRPWLEEVMATLGNSPVSPADLECLKIHLHESSGASGVPQVEGSSEAQLWFWGELAARSPDNAELAVLALDVDYHHFGNKAVLDKFIEIALAHPLVIYNTALYGELYDQAKQSGPIIWARYRLLSVLALTSELGEVGEEIIELVTEIVSELPDVPVGSSS